MSIQVRCGSGNSIDIPLGDRETVSDVVNDPSVKSLLGYGDNISVSIAGATVAMDDPIRDGDAISIESRSNTKG